MPGEAARAAAFTDSLDAIESHLEARSSGSSETTDTGPWMLGSTFSLADVKIASFMERAAASVPFYRGLVRQLAVEL